MNVNKLHACNSQEDSSTCPMLAALVLALGARDAELCLAQLHLEGSDALARQLCSLTYVSVFGHTESGTTLTEA